eukprot:4015131-Amphidinium_carterae.1
MTASFVAYPKPQRTISSGGKEHWHVWRGCIPRGLGLEGQLVCAVPSLQWRRLWPAEVRMHEEDCRGSDR